MIHTLLLLGEGDEEFEKREICLNILKKLSHHTISVLYMIAEKLNSKCWKERVLGKNLKFWPVISGDYFLEKYARGVFHFVHERVPIMTRTRKFMGNQVYTLVLF